MPGMGAYVVPSLATTIVADEFQFKWHGYFAVDTDCHPCTKAWILFACREESRNVVMPDRKSVV